MGSIMLKCLLSVCITLGVSSALAQSSSYDDFRLSSCSPMSKDPKCWEDYGYYRTSRPRPILCRSRSSCVVIESVQLNSMGKYECKAATGYGFSCERLVKQFGVNLEGMSVKLTTPYVDTCHILGGCGDRACSPGHGSASLDPSCQ